MASSLSDQILMAVINKLLLGGVILGVGYLVNKSFERFRVQIREEQAQRQKIFDLEEQLSVERLNEELKLVERQISEFYWPIYLRLEKDNVMWLRISYLSSSQEVLPQEASNVVEREFLLKNHDEIIEIIESKIHLIGDPLDSEDLIEELLKYIKHIAVYKTIRSVKSLEEINPIDLDEPFPKKLFPLIKKNFYVLQTRQEELKTTKSKRFKG
ncbi:MAG: hypothetical protein AAGF83_07835 [Cyanobacteria bacterium P01_G01_bin.67]